jgi:hypothetical protein
LKLALLIKLTTCDFSRRQLRFRRLHARERRFQLALGNGIFLGEALVPIDFAFGLGIGRLSFGDVGVRSGNLKRYIQIDKGTELLSAFYFLTSGDCELTDRSVYLSYNVGRPLCLKTNGIEDDLRPDLARRRADSPYIHGACGHHRLDMAAADQVVIYSLTHKRAGKNNDKGHSGYKKRFHDKYLRFAIFNPELLL